MHLFLRLLQFFLVKSMKRILLCCVCLVLVCFLSLFLCKIASVVKALVKRCCRFKNICSLIGSPVLLWGLYRPLLCFVSRKQWAPIGRRWMERIALAVHTQNPKPAAISLNSEVHPHHDTELLRLVCSTVGTISIIRHLFIYCRCCRLQGSN